MAFAGLTTVSVLTFALGCILRYYAHQMSGGGGGGGNRGGGGSANQWDMRDVYLWLAVAALFISGILAVNTFVGDFLTGIAELAPWVGWVWTLILVLGTLKDLKRDKEPDKVAPWFLFQLPSVSNGLGGDFGDMLNKMWDSFSPMVNDLVVQLFVS